MHAGVAAALEDMLRSLNNLQERMHRGDLLYARTGAQRVVAAPVCGVPAALIAAALALQVTHAARRTRVSLARHAC
jgi:hypothetical protein